MHVSFHRPKPQPEHEPAVLACVQRIPPGVTSGTPIHLWDLRKIQGTRLEEVINDLVLEIDDA
jgi:hypothetical protein